AESADECVALGKVQRVAVKKPDDQRDAKNTQHLSQHGKYILGADKPAVEQGEARNDHQKNKCGRNAYPDEICFIHVVDSYSAASSNSPVRMRTACSMGVMN